MKVSFYLFNFLNFRLVNYSRLIFSSYLSAVAPFNIHLGVFYENKIEYLVVISSVWRFDNNSNICFIIMQSSNSAESYTGEYKAGEECYSKNQHIACHLFSVTPSKYRCINWCTRDILIVLMKHHGSGSI